MKLKSYIFILVIFIILSSSCNKRVRYIYKKDQKQDTVYSYKTNSEGYKLKPNDLLHINIMTTDEEINKLFQIGNQSANNSSSSNGGGGFYLFGFTVNDSGYVQVPILGSLPAAGKTVSEFRTDVTSKTHEYLNDAIVSVKFVSFKISFLGEVNSPGTINIFQDNIDILEAVARAGGISEYGNMKKLTVVRKAENERIVYKLDLTDRELLSSEKFYLYPDDIVMVEPRNGKIFNTNLRDYVFVLSALTSSISTSLFIINLLKAE